MRIYSMTATFGKLENQTLTLEPGLNIIHAPNEWGKSTWCAFLTTMLYGLDTRAKTTKAALADKERYAPWSGAPMSGRMDLNWNGRDITIERRAKGRTPMGEFAAYETATGIPVRELTATTCGQVLLGVERAVFQRAGFIQLSQLPVTQDEALRRRLNALVTTGDEDSAADDLAQKLKDLKNKCRYNRSGLLPQAEAQREALENTLREQAYLQDQETSIRDRQAELERDTRLLENHLAALEYAQSQAVGARLSQAEAARQAAGAQVEALEQLCESLPSQGQIGRLQARLEALQEQKNVLDAQQLLLPPIPTAPQPAAVWPGVAQAQQDRAQWQALEASKKKNGWILGGFAAVALVLLALLLVPQMRPFAFFIGLAVCLLGAAALSLCTLRTRKLRGQIDRLFEKYPGIPPQNWVPLAQQQEQQENACREDLAWAQAQHADFAARRAALDEQIAAFAQGKTLDALRRQYEDDLRAYESLDDARRSHRQAQAHIETLQALVKPAQPPREVDKLTLTESQTRQKLSECAFESKQLHTRLGQFQGKMEALGSREALQAQLEAVNSRIANLTKTYNALELAIATLNEAGTQLQRRFAPRIARQAQEIFGKLTAGRYDRLILSEDLSIQAAAQAETTLRPALWRSEGTTDQLYLSLRLAVARELTPDAPLVLDDALARFDEGRMQAALEVLRQEAQKKQVLLFTCHEREKQAL